LQVTENWEEWLGVVLLSRGTSTDWRWGLAGTLWSSARRSEKSHLWRGTIPGTRSGKESSSAEALQKEALQKLTGPCGAWRTLEHAIVTKKARGLLGCIRQSVSKQGKGGDPSPLLTVGEAAPRVHCSVLDYSL